MSFMVTIMLDVVYTCTPAREYQPTSTQDRVLYGFSDMEEATRSSYGGWVWEVQLSLVDEEEVPFCWSSGEGDYPEGREWGINQRGWYHYSPLNIHEVRLVSAPGCQ